MRTHILAAVLATSLLGGCASTATIHRWGAPALEADVVDADDANIYVTDRGGRRYRVPRKDVADVDHPGNVLMIVGAVIVALGTSMYLDDGRPGDTDEEVRNMHITGIVFAVPGALLAGWGTYSWWTSRSIEGRRGEARPSPIPGIADVTALPAPAEVPAQLPVGLQVFAPKPPPPSAP